jgi:hypothetical protein
VDSLPAPPTKPPTTRANSHHRANHDQSPRLASFNRLDLAAHHGLTISTYAAESGWPSEEALKVRGSWAATVDPAALARATDQS